MEYKEISKFNKERYAEYMQQKKRKDIPESEYITKMRDPNNVVEFDEVQTYFYTDAGTVKAVDKVTFDVPYGKTVGIVGESGCGKSVTSLSLMRLVMGPIGQIAGGAIRFNDGKRAVNIAKAPEHVMQEIRGRDISMIFQEPMTSLNPVFTIGDQLNEILELHMSSLSKTEMYNRVIDMLQKVGISRCEEIYKSYPHELSGGMRQRVMIAMAILCSPRLIIADEPTTALDVTIQAQILDLLRSVKSSSNASIMLITHDLGVIAEMADIVAVMYAGRIVEMGTVYDIYQNPQHPYTIGLIESRPSSVRTDGTLHCIPGQVPNPINMPQHCYFKDRCEKTFTKCEDEYPSITKVSDTHTVACYLRDKRYNMK